MITGSHTIIYTQDEASDRAFFRDVLGLPYVDAGDGWLIFGLPTSEMTLHPSGEGGIHEIYFMCNDITAFVASMSEQGIACTAVENRGWGLLTTVTLPGGGTIGVYEPKHERP